jgi:hypothetical protein
MEDRKRQEHRGEEGVGISGCGSVLEDHTDLLGLTEKTLVDWPNVARIDIYPMVTSGLFVHEFKFDTSPASYLDELNRFSYHSPDGDLVFEGQIVEEAGREPIE